MLADLYRGPLGNPGAAFSALARVFERAPRDFPVRESLLPLASEAGKLGVLGSRLRALRTIGR